MRQSSAPGRALMPIALHAQKRLLQGLDDVAADRCGQFRDWALPMDLGRYLMDRSALSPGDFAQRFPHFRFQANARPPTSDYDVVNVL